MLIVPVFSAEAGLLFRPLVRPINLHHQHLAALGGEDDKIILLHLVTEVPQTGTALPGILPRMVHVEYEGANLSGRAVASLHGIARTLLSHCYPLVHVGPAQSSFCVFVMGHKPPNLEGLRHVEPSGDRETSL